MVPNPVYKRLSLYSNPSTYTFVPTDGGDRSLTLNRTTGQIEVGSKFQTTLSNEDLYNADVYGIIGIISLAITDYVVIITGRELKGELFGHDIYRATSFDILPINPDVNFEAYPAENYLVGLLRKHLEDGLFWFSCTWDLTRRLQAQWKDGGSARGLWEVADDRFFWNKYLQSRLIEIARKDPEKKINTFILPIIYGTFDIRPITVRDHAMRFCLISRRSRYRAGTRYFRRGADRNGHVANFVETEQIILADRSSKGNGEFSAHISFVQVRGSIPLYWAEVNNLRYKPELQVMEHSDSDEAMRAHLQDLADVYGDSNLINLVNHKGHEKPIKEAFETYVEKVNHPKVKYEYFDFHNECKNMRWDRIGILIEKIRDDLSRNGYFCEDSENPDVVKLQQGVVRTNCMDNLDRTNVAQSAIAKWMLNQQLRDIGIFKDYEGVDDHRDFMFHFRNMWADHADAISKAYSGTGALKTDFTRTGKRSYKGALGDGVNSVMRYLKNNYLDGPRQDGFDLFTGEWTPRRGASTLSTIWLDTRPLLIRSMPPLASLAIFMICAGLTLPRTSDYSLAFWFALWFSVLWMALAFVFAHGVSYVSWPRLNPLTDVINYEGPGFVSKRRGRGLRFLATVGKTGRTSRNAEKTKGKLVTSQEVEMGSFEKKRVD